MILFCFVRQHTVRKINELQGKNHDECHDLLHGACCYFRRGARPFAIGPAGRGDHRSVHPRRLVRRHRCVPAQLDQDAHHAASRLLPEAPAQESRHNQGRSF